jgi:hypothetical protein
MIRCSPSPMNLVRCASLNPQRGALCIFLALGTLLLCTLLAGKGLPNVSWIWCRAPILHPGLHCQFYCAPGSILKHEMAWRSIIQGGNTAGQGSFSFPRRSSNMLMLPQCWSQKACRFLLDIKIIICLLNLPLCLFPCLMKVQAGSEKCFFFQWIGVML